MTGLGSLLNRRIDVVGDREAVETRGSLDWMMLAVLLLCCLGLIMAVSISGSDLSVGALSAVKSQGYKLAVGLVFFVLVAMVPIELFWFAARPAYWVVTGLVYFAAWFGTSANGAQRWIDLGPMTIQPVDLARFCTVIYTARIITEVGDDIVSFRRGILRIMLPSLVLAAGLLAQPDNGNAVFTLALGSCMAIVAGVPLRYFSVAALPAVAVLGWVVVQKSYAVDRLTGFLDPERGGQVWQSLVAIASGGITGQGLGSGWMKMGFVPEAHNDFIFAVVAEELGTVGSVIVIALFVAIGIAGLRLVLACQERFLRSLVFGFTIAICMQACINLLVVTGMAPAKGIDLPFLSSGGTSLVVYLAAVGLIGNAVRADARFHLGRQ